MKVCFTVDMEQDCPPFLETFRGIEEGAPRLLKTLKDKQVLATFFTTGDVARRYPKLMQEIVAGGHELACHGDSHRKFSAMDSTSAKQEIQRSSEALRAFYPVVSFRAPNLEFPDEYLSILQDHGYLLDSSQAKYKWAYRKSKRSPSPIRRIPASVTSSVLRLPKALRFAWLGRIRDPAVLFMHPWEFVDFRKSTLRRDCRFKTGEPALQCLGENIEFYSRQGASFHRMQDLIGPSISS